MTSVLIADDHTLFRAGLRAILETAPDCVIVGDAADGEDALRQAAELKPDVVLMDIHMPKLSGIEAARRLLVDHPGTGIIMLTMLEDDASVFAAMRAGARGYILKGADRDDVLRAIRAVAQGEALFGSAVAARIGSFFEGSATDTAAFPELTEREREVLTLIAQGLDNSEICARLFISVKTLGNHISRIFGKLQVADRAKAIVKARDAGIGV